MLAPTPWDANVNRGYISTDDEGPCTHVFTETEALLHGWDTGELAQARTGDRPDWSTVEYLVNRGLRDEFLPARASPSRKRATIPDPEQLVATRAGSELTRSQVVTFNSIALWLGISRQNLMALLGARSSQMSRLVRTLVREGLVHNLDTRADLRYAPTETGIRYWAEGDRTDLSGARGKWASEGDGPADWKGTAISKLFGSEREHTPRLYWIVSSLSEAAREREDATLEWVLPAHRAVRHFYIDGKQRTSIRPDALGALQLGERYVPFMLEYERQALYPKEARERLERYRNYFVTGLPVGGPWNHPLGAVRVPDRGARGPFRGRSGRGADSAGSDVQSSCPRSAGRAIGELASPMGPFRQRTRSTLGPDISRGLHLGLPA